MVISFLLSFLIIKIGFWAWFYFSLGKYKNEQESIEEPSINLPSVSIVIVFKNEKNRIKNLILNLLEQDYPDFEIIAMDDFSEDNATEDLNLIVDQRLGLFMASTNVLGKKMALSEAIEYAKNDLLLLTDADCLPTSDQWIKSMVDSKMTKPNCGVVLGYGPMNCTSGMINKFARFETFMTAMQYFTYALSKIPYMGVGRNIMYQKTLFNKVGGFEKHKNIISGDDDLFVSSIIETEQIGINLDRNSFIYSDAKTTIGSFFRQKSRHISTSFYYKWYHKLLLGIFAITHIGFYTILIYSLISGALSITVGFGILVMKWILQMLLHHEFLKILDVKDLKWWFPVLDLGWFVYLISISLYSFASKPKW